PHSAGSVTAVESNLCETLIDGTCHAYAESHLRLPELLAPQGEVPTLIVGAELARKFKLTVGMHVALTTPVGIAARGNAPKRMELVVAGSFRSGMYDFDSRLIYVEMSVAQRLLGMGNTVSGVEFRVKNLDRAEETAERVLRAVGHYPYRKLDWRKLNEGIFVALEMQK